MSFSVISDIHLRPEVPRSVHNFRIALNDISKLDAKSDALVIVGDLGEGQERDYALLKSSLKTAFPSQQVLFSIGNHEYYKAWYDEKGHWNRTSFPNGESSESSLKRFLRLTGKERVYYDEWLKGYHLIFLGSETYDRTLNEFAYLSSQQLQWLQAKLSDNYVKGKPVFVFLHQPLQSVMQRCELEQILNKYPEVYLFSGHTHDRLHAVGSIEKKTFTCVNDSSVFENLEGLYVKALQTSVEIQGRNYQKGTWIHLT